MTRYFNYILAALFLFLASAPAWGAKTVFQDGNAAMGVQGTVVNSAFLNSIMSMRHDNINSDGHAPLDYAVDAGTTNTCVVNLPLPLTQHIPGMPIWFMVSATNTGATTLQFLPLPAVPLLNAYGTPLLAGDIKAGQIVQVAYDGANYRLMSGDMLQSFADTRYQLQKSPIDPWMSSISAGFLPNVYPTGLSSFSVANDSSWPQTYGQVVTIKGDSTGVIQYFYPDSTTGITAISIRTAPYNSNAWSAWALLNTQHASPSIWTANYYYQSNTFWAGNINYNNTVYTISAERTGVGTYQFFFSPALPSAPTISITSMDSRYVQTAVVSALSTTSATVVFHAGYETGGSWMAGQLFDPTGWQVSLTWWP